MQPNEIFDVIENGVIPKRVNENRAGFDVFNPTKVIVTGREPTVLKMGLKIKNIPNGYYIQVRPRSSAMKRGILVDGVIDRDYKDEIFSTVSRS